ncbi:TfoX/Sxy family protein [Sulfitobacter sp. D35]|uniref:TfoX/Sxy family protein n=1 Tax=Sulfitobacter sp. D35 TaxID=3083252 RepID=UPI00296F5E5A|nr:TfoX/Sxy family protein [Sulfitobacter sp. D35]MDW4496735.1 TfoX/Sxy family protein [Sulfitobacter sp. D35]
MALTPEQIDHAVELFEGVGTITTRRMFGGMCLYIDGTVFALLRSDGTVLLKAVNTFRDRVEAEGWTRWEYTRDNGTRSAMPYWELPEAALDDPDEARALARASLAAM